MKNFILTIGLLVFCLTSKMEAQQVSLAGRVTDSGSGFGVGSYNVTATVYDSLTMNQVMQMTAITDSLGDYNISFLTSNGPWNGYGEVSVDDCNGTIHTLNFAFTNGTAMISNLDFWICVPAAGCNAAFMAIPQNGTNQVAFNDYSTTNLGSIISWDWQFGDGSSGSGLNMMHTYPAMGTYYTCLTITTNTGCTATYCDSVVAGSHNANCQANLNYGIFPSGAYGFSVTAAGTGVPVNYLYDFGDGNTLSTGSDSVLYAYPNNGSYWACVTVLFSDSCVVTGCLGVVTPNLACNASFSAIPDTSGQYSLLLINNSTGSGLNYQWDFGDGGTSNSAYPSHTYAGPGTYEVCLTVWDSTNTCSSVFCDSITVINKLGAAFTIQVVPGVLTATSSPLAANADMVIFPNPATDRVQVRVKTERPGALHCEIRDLTGRIVAFQHAGIQPEGAHSFDFEVSSVASGMYLLYLQSGKAGSTQLLQIAH